MILGAWERVGTIIGEHEHTIGNMSLGTWELQLGDWEHDKELGYVLLKTLAQNFMCTKM